MNRYYNNFDFIRFVAAMLVIVTHSYPLSGLPEESDPLCQITRGTIEFSYLGVRVFFIISGFLICQSLIKSKNYKDYFIKRSLRIFPGLIVVVLLTVLVLGPFTTAIPLPQYFKSNVTYTYFLNIFLYPVRYFLPGVFEKNPFSGVINGSLWTLKYEFTLYIVLAAFLFLKLLNKFMFSIILLAVIIFRLFFFEQQKLDTIPGFELNVKLMVDFTLYFFTGTFFYLYQDLLRDKLNFYVFGIVTMLWFLSFCTGFAEYSSYLFFPVLTFYLAFLPGSLNHFARRGDFSYGIYIYAFPVQQLLVYLTHNSLSLFWLIVLSAIVTFILAVASWHLIEKRFLQLKTRLR